VELALSGREAEIKEYAIGVDVFERGEEFDPKTDPIVRVQAGRLRLKLAEYYSVEGKQDSIRIELPKGSYIPAFHIGAGELRSTDSAEAANTAAIAPEAIKIPAPFRNHRRTVIAATALVILLLVSSLGFLWWKDRSLNRPGRPQLQRLTHDWAIMPALSPDGKLVVYSSDRAGEGALDLWVQPVSGGDAVRLTKLPETEWTPSFSPNGTTVVFWYSGIQPGGSPDEGLYQVPVLGGEPRKILGGYTGNPRYSPNGEWIAFTGGRPENHALSIIPSGGGSPKLLAPGLVDSAFPSWSRDGKHIIFLGTQAGKEPLLKRRDWWVIPAEGGTPVRTGAVEAMVRQGVIARDEDTEFVWPSAWYGDRIVFRGGRNLDSIHIWTLRLNAKSFQVEGEARQVTFGGAREVLPAVSENGTLVFCGQTGSRDFWSVPVDPNTGRAGSTELRQITRNSGSNGIGAVSRDGKSLVFNREDNGNSDIRTLNLDTNSGNAAIATSAQEHLLAISDDATQLLYLVFDHGERAIFAGAPREGNIQKVCKDCDAMLSPDGSKVYYSGLDRTKDPREVRVLNLRTGTHGEGFSVSKDICFPCSTSRLSPDGRWAASLRTAKAGKTVVTIHSVPDGKGKPIKVAATVGRPGDGFPYWSKALSLLDWSPDGNLLYFASDRDRHRCIWAQRLQPITKRPVAEPFAVLHNHVPLSHTLHSMTVTRNELVLGLHNGISDIWMTRLD